MPRSTAHPKQENFNFRVPANLKAAFQSATESADRPAAQVIRDFMRAYVDEHQKADAGHDHWFRSQVQEALDDPRPAVPHDKVVQRAQFLLKQMIREKQSRAD